MNYEIKNMNIFNNGKKIYGELYTPLSDKFPLVIISHGLGGNHTGSQDIADALVKEGIGVYIFDFCGGSYESKSDGKTTEMSVLTEASDLETVIDELKKVPKIDADKIFLIGKSQGAYVSTIVASKRPEEIKGLIGLYSGYVLEDTAKEEAEKYHELPEETTILWLKVGKKYISDLLETNIYGLMRKYYGDVLLLHGTADNIAPISYSEEAAETFPNARLEVIEGAEHGFHGPERPKVIEMIKEFIKERTM